MDEDVNDRSQMIRKHWIRWIGSTWTIACQIMRQTSEYLLSKFSIMITRVSASTIIEIYNATISVEMIKNSRLFIARLDMQLRNGYPIGFVRC